MILLTARSEEPDRVLGLELGADDGCGQALLACASWWRGSNRVADDPLPAAELMDFGRLMVDPGQRQVLGGWSPGGADLAREFDLLAFLAATPKRVYTRAQLLEQVWDSSAEWQADPATVTVHIRRIRQKIEDQPDQPLHLVTVWGVGYKFEA